MSRFALMIAPMMLAAICGCSDEEDAADENPMTFFVSSETSPNGNLGGLSGADAKCDRLATAVGAGNKTWRAYLSTDTENAKDRIGDGPWMNANGDMVAANVAALHSRTGDPEIFVDENGEKINGQWAGSPTPVQHDVLTGSQADGTLARDAMTNEPLTCNNWTSNSADFAAQVGHTDGMGPMMATTPANLTSWNGSHVNQDCSDTAPRGGSGRVYCFAAD
jgi:hypothetical protein